MVEEVEGEKTRITMEVPATEIGSQSSEPTMAEMLLGLCVDTSLDSQVSIFRFRKKHCRMSIGCVHWLPVTVRVNQIINRKTHIMIFDISCINLFQLEDI